VTTTPEHTTIGGYRLLARIGEGGMGIVHLARRTGTGDRDAASARVALKVLRPHVIGDAEARRRLAQEVAALERVRSPRIAEILDADPYGETPFVVTRYVPGLSLNRYVEEEGVVAGHDLVHFATCLAEALQAVHGVGVLHRDVKPSNVLMEGRSPVLIDFGLARAAEDPTLTATGFMLGTPGYLPPEVLYGDPATAAGDVYAWAATVVYAASGRPPFGKGHTMAIMDRVRRGEHDLGDVPEPLAGLLRRCLAVEPLDRPTVGEALALLRSWPPRASSVATDETWTRPVTALEPEAPVPAGFDPDPDLADEPITALLTSQVFEPPPPAHTRLEQALRLLVRVALGAAMVGAVAFAPYVVLAILAGLVLLLRTASVTRQRHLRRQDLRGRPRWYDVPTTTLSLPGYVVLAAGGALVLVVFAGLVGLGATALATLAGWSVPRSVLSGAVVLTPCLWWGPGSARVREMVAPLLDRSTHRPRAVLAFVVICAVLALGLLAVVTTQGPNWYPELEAPWK
jgi:predicted Ser/Thr protein kinase